MPFFGLYLQNKGFGGTAISTVLISLPIVQLLGNPVYGWLADTKFQRRTIFRTALVVVVLLTVGFYWVESYAAIFAFVAVHSFFRLPNVSILNAALFERLGKQGNLYARIRTGGSLGFIVFALLAGVWVERFGVERLPDVLLLAVVAMLLVGWPTPVNVPAGSSKPQLGAWRRFWRDRRWRLFLLTVCMSRIGDTCYNIFYGIHLKDLGHSAEFVSAMWTVAVLSEVAVFWWAPYWLKRWRLETLLFCSYVAALLRWSLTAIVVDPLGLALLQTLHGLTFGLFYVAAVDWAFRESPDGFHTTGQAITNAAMFGLSGIAGSLISGPAYDWLAGAGVFAVATLTAAAAVTLAWFWSTALPRGGQTNEAVTVNR